MCVCTLVDDEAVFRQVGSGDALGIGSQQEQDFGWIFPDGIHAGLVAKVQRSHLTGHSTRTHTKYEHVYEQGKKEKPLTTTQMCRKCRVSLSCTCAGR